MTPVRISICAHCNAPPNWGGRAEHPYAVSRAVPGLVGLALLLALSSCTSNSRLHASDEAIVAWARGAAIPLGPTEAGTPTDDLDALLPIIGDARVIVLGESVHLSHEFLALRNRLFRYLVEEQNFAAIAVESGFTETLAVDRYVRGGPGSRSVARHAFSWLPDSVWAENVDLVEWMRAHNEQNGGVRPLRFYGFDLPGGRWGQRILEGRIAADSAMAYLSEAGLAEVAPIRSAMDHLLDQFSEDMYASLPRGEHVALAEGLRRLEAVFDSQRDRLVARTGREAYDTARHNMRNAGWVRDLQHALFERPGDVGEVVRVRDAAMAENIRWILDQLGPSDRILVFAHNLHAMTATMWPMDDDEGYPNGTAPAMGEHLVPLLGDDLIVLGTVFGSGRTAYGATFGPPERGSLEDLLGSVDEPMFVLPMGEAHVPSDLRDLLSAPRRTRSASAYGSLEVSQAFDAVIYLDGISPSQNAADRLVMVTHPDS